MYNSIDSGSIFGPLIITLIVLIIIFLICRELICWYYKINEMINIQNQQNSILNDILTQLKSKPSIIDSSYKNDSLSSSISSEGRIIKFTEKVLETIGKEQKIKINFDDGVSGEIFSKIGLFIHWGITCNDTEIFYTTKIASIDGLYHFATTGNILQNKRTENK